jgi:hypothetical protein
MTIQIAASLPDSSEAIIISDSQMSSITEEAHGAQKILAGEDYLVGCAGSGMIIGRLFEKLYHDVNIDGSNVIQSIEQFMIDEVQQPAQAEIGMLALTPSAGVEPAIQQFSPGVFKHFGKRSKFASIGSGSEFVSRAISRDGHNGISHPIGSLIDLIITASNLADAATESLTVDEFHLLGILRNGRTYLLGHRDISPQFLAPALTAPGVWTAVSKAFEDVHALIQTIRSELRVAMESASVIANGGLTAILLARLQAANAAIVTSRTSLASRLTDYFQWYDGIMGRPKA